MTSLLLLQFRRIGICLLKRSTSRCSTHTASPRPVNSHNEWDPLEEVIVGRIGGFPVPPFTAEVKAVTAEHHWPFFEQNGGKAFPQDAVKKAKEEVENFCAVLEGEGVIVRRPDLYDFNKEFKTPDFYSPVGVDKGMPR